MTEPTTFDFGDTEVSGDTQVSGHHNGLRDHSHALQTVETRNSGRKEIPLATGCLDYFPLALQAVAHASHVGQAQHNPGKPLAWDREKSGDEADALMRHFVERGRMDTDGVKHSAKVAWRALALLQKELERDAG